MYFIVGVPLLCFTFAPFPFGCGVIYPIRDSLRGHPEGKHGTHPQKFVGLWVRNEVEIYDFHGQAFYLMPDGQIADMGGMTERRWHFDKEVLFVDSVSHCGTCYHGNVTTEYTSQFLGADELRISNRNRDAVRGVSGVYHRVEITHSLKSEMGALKESKDENESFKARMVLMAIERFEILSK